MTTLTNEEGKITVPSYLRYAALILAAGHYYVPQIIHLFTSPAFCFILSVVLQFLCATVIFFLQAD
jgi:hypothetical protein